MIVAVAGGLYVLSHLLLFEIAHSQHGGVGTGHHHAVQPHGVDALSLGDHRPAVVATPQLQPAAGSSEEGSSATAAEEEAEEAEEAEEEEEEEEWRLPWYLGGGLLDGLAPLSAPPSLHTCFDHSAHTTVVTL